MIEDLKITREKDGRNLDTSVNGKTLLYAESEQGVYGGVSVDALKPVINSGVTDDCVKIIQQALTAGQKQQARQNIDAMPTDESVVKYSAQTLTDAEKTQARTNIGAAEENAQYKAGDVVPLRVIVSNGYITSSQSNIHFDLILRKEVPSNLKVNLQGIVSIRENGYYLMPAQNMAGTDLGFEASDSSITVNSYVSTTGVKIVLAVPKWYRQNSSIVAENNYPVSVNITSGTLTFS